MNLHAIGIDLGKTTFHLVGLNQAGEVQVRKKFSRSQLLRFTANVQVDLIGMEACAGSHFLGKALHEQGHEARLMPAQYVKPFVKTNKNDFIDAEAIAEAVSRPSMRFVPIKTDEQLDMQSLHRVRERWIMRRTSVVNQIRGLLLERGITVRTGRCHLDAALPNILEDGSTSLSGTLRFLLVELKQELEQLAGHIEQAEMLIERAAQQSEACQRLDAIPGIGPLTGYRTHRSDWKWRSIPQGPRVRRLGRTGASRTLHRRQAEASRYQQARQQLSAETVCSGQCSGLKHWLAELSSRNHYNVVGVALANKLARMAWAVLASENAYRPPVLADTTGLQMPTV
jgi:transposase